MAINKLHSPGNKLKNEVSIKEKNFWALDWLRFILAIYLVMFHTLNGKYEPIRDTWLEASLKVGNMATTVFFVLSGFLLTYAYVQTKNGQDIDRRKFFIARFSTLYPLHLLGLLLALVPSLYAIYKQGGLTVPIEPSGSATRMLSHSEVLLGLLSNVAMLNAWNPYYLLINIPSWSLSALAFFYLVFPVVAPRVFRSNRPALLLLLCGALFALPGLVADMLQRTDLLTNGLLHRNPVLRLPLFVAGIALCTVFARAGVKGTARQSAVLGMIVVSTALGGMYLQFHDVHLHIIKNGLYLPAALALVWLCACIKPIANEKIRYWGARLGAASLPLFFLHVPAYSLYDKFEKLLVGTFMSKDWRLSSIAAAAREAEPALALYPLFLVILVVSCVMVQERFVMPVQARIRNYLAERHTRGLAVEKKVSTG